MPHEHTIHNHSGEGVKLAGNPEELINLLIADKSERKWALDQIVNEGPVHKQVLSALLLMRLYKLVKTIEKSTGTTFQLQNGLELINDKDEKVLPVLLPINLSQEMNKEEIANTISHAPEHEALAYAMSIQVIEWAINATTKK